MKKCKHDYESGSPVYIGNDIKIEDECMYCGKIVLFDFKSTFIEFLDKKEKSILDKTKYS